MQIHEDVCMYEFLYLAPGIKLSTKPALPPRGTQDVLGELHWERGHFTATKHRQLTARCFCFHFRSDIFKAL